ncbi:hypothetical protein HNY73_015929 [Argiope bruennichi]|uniref:Tetraspanin n=1 Tax=Argiope bruennichi TaxID=94029 RepID=A0A8T0EL65_ARGBR|nr:hypothetical protein HNY73_015929 [Argiope bruennichi]
MEHTEEREEEHRPTHGQLIVVSFTGGFTFLTGMLGYWGALHLAHTMGCIILKENTMNLVKTQVDETLPIFKVQKFLHCCGAKSPYDWIESKWWHHQRAENFKFVVPISCCIAPQKNWTCNMGKSPYRDVVVPTRIYQKGCANLVLEQKKYLILAGGYGILLCGLGQLISFFAIHYLVNVILTYQLRLDEIREQVPEAAHVRKPPHDPRAEARFEKRMSMKV